MTSIEKFEETNSSFNQYIELHKQQLRKYSLRLTRDADDAEDLYQDTLIRLFLNMHKIENEKVFIKWGKTVMKNIYLDKLRSDKRRVNTVSYDTILPEIKNYHNVGHLGRIDIDFQDTSVDVENEVLLKIVEEKKKKHLRHSINALATVQRDTLSLRLYGRKNPLDAKSTDDGLSYPEVARALNSTEDAVRSSLSRAVNNVTKSFVNSTW